ncbi:MAG TPA: hypothetical protein VKA60_10505 [Blastocatellia bacterium]|nr:hypothetical protein [Blastocatellia bacterium]
MAEIKGVLLNAWVDLLKQRYGEQAVMQAFEVVSRNDPSLRSAFFLPTNWYPYSALDSLRQVTRALATPGTPTNAVEVGQHMAAYVFTGVYRALLAKDPVKQLEKFPTIREFFFHDTHKLEIEHTGESRCIVRYRYEPGLKPTRAVCESLGGFWSKALDLAGATDTRFAHPNCILKGYSCCEFALEWQRPAS